MFSPKDKSIIYKAFDMYYADYCKTLPSNDELSHIFFTKEFEQKMQKLIEKESKFYFYWFNTIAKRVAIIILAIIISLTSVTFGVKAIREPVVRFIVETFERFSNVVFINDKSEGNVIVDFTFEKITPTYIPEEYKLDSDFTFDNAYQATYVNNNSTIIYSQYINDDSISQVNTENVTYESITINNVDAIFYSNKGTNTIIISGDRYIFTVEGTIEKEELLKIVESIKIN